MIYDGDKVRVILVYDPKSPEKSSFSGRVTFHSSGVLLQQGEDENRHVRTLFFPFHSIRLVEKLV